MRSRREPSVSNATLKGGPMPATHEPPKRRRFLGLRVLFFLLSLPFVWWAVVRYGGSAAGYAQSYAKLTGFWLWFWTLVIIYATWSIWRLVKRKWTRAKELAGEARAPRR